MVRQTEAMGTLAQMHLLDREVEDLVGEVGGLEDHPWAREEDRLVLCQGVDLAVSDLLLVVWRLRRV